MTKSAVALGALIPLALVIWLKMAGFLALATGLLSTLVLLSLAKVNLGGVTGDVLGMTIEIAEVAVLVPFVIQ